MVLTSDTIFLGVVLPRATHRQCLCDSQSCRKLPMRKEPCPCHTPTLYAEDRIEPALQSIGPGESFPFRHGADRGRSPIAHAG